MKVIKSNFALPLTSLIFFLALGIVAESAIAQSTQTASGEDQAPKTLGFHLQRARTGQDSEEGALFSLLRDNNKDDNATVYSADFYLTCSPNEAGINLLGAKSPNIDFFAFAEGHIASDKDAAEDAWRFGTAGQWYTRLNPLLPNMDDNWEKRLTVTGFYTELALTYESDRDFETEQLLVDLSTTPNIPGSGVGHEIPWDPAAPVHLRWRPIFGLELGKTLDSEETDEDVPDTVFRLYGKFDGRLRLNFLSDALQKKVESIDLFIQDKFYYVPNVGGGRTHNLWIAGLQMNFNENVGLQVAYTIGEDSPEFDKTETLEIGFTVRF